MASAALSELILQRRAAALARAAKPRGASLTARLDHELRAHNLPSAGVAARAAAGWSAVAAYMLLFQVQARPSCVAQGGASALTPRIATRHGPSAQPWEWMGRKWRGEEEER